MKKMRRFLSILLVLTLIFSLWSPAYAMEGDGVKLSMMVSQSKICVGDPIALTIQADQNFTSRGAGMTIYYDDAVLELDVDNSAAATPFRIDGPLTVNGKTAVRISFLPGLDAAIISATEPLAELSFKALAGSEQTAVSMGAAYLYDSTLAEIPLTMPEAVDVKIESNVPVTGISLDMTELTLEEGEMAALKATVEPANASNTTIIWTSSDEKAVVVSDGVLKGLTAGTATITATTEDGGFTAECTITVKAPDVGYTVKMPVDTAAVIGGMVQIPVTISNADGETGYNAFDVNFTYDPDVLELISTTLPGMTVTVNRGKINVLGYGEYRSAGSVPFTLEFRTRKMEATEVQITTARVDNAGNAMVKNVSLATLTDDTTAITVTGYSVTLPDGFTGANTAEPNKDYTFTEPDDYYDYTVKATVDGTEVNVTDNGDGSYTIPAEYVTGEIVVTATKTGKVFNVTLGTDMSGEATARYGIDYTATIDRDEAYTYIVTMTIGGREYTGYGVLDDSYVIFGEDITGDIVFAVAKTPIKEQDPSDPTEPSVPTQPGVPTEPSVPTQPGVPTEPSNPTDPSNPSEPGDPTEPSDPTQPSNPTEPSDPGTEPAPPTQPVTMHSVKFTGSGAGAAQGNATSVAHGSSYTFSLKKQAGYNYQVSYKMGGKPAVALSPNANGTYTIKNVTAPLEIIIEKSLDIAFSVKEYLTLDEKSVFLVLADAMLSDESIFTYDGEAMYYNDAYGAWAYLVITDQELNVDQIRSKVKISTQTNRVVTPSGDVDENGKVDMNDAKLILELYDAKYDTFDAISMMKYLRADVNSDRRVDVRDVTWVVWKIWEREDERA